MRLGKFTSTILVMLFSVTLVGSAVPAAFAAEANSSAPKAVQKKDTAYVGSSQSKVYHLPTCGLAKNIKPENLVKFSSKAQAVKAGYVPCKVCIKK